MNVVGNLEGEKKFVDMEVFGRGIVDVEVSSKCLVDFALVGMGCLGYFSNLGCRCFEIPWVLVNLDILPLHSHLPVHY